MRMVAPRTGAPEITVAEDQLEYHPIVMAVYDAPRTLLSRWTLTAAERWAIYRGEDVYIGLCTFGAPMQPIRVTVGPKSWEVK